MHYNSEYQSEISLFTKPLNIQIESIAQSNHCQIIEFLGF